MNFIDFSRKVPNKNQKSIKQYKKSAKILQNSRKLKNGPNFLENKVKFRNVLKIFQKKITFFKLCYKPCLSNDNDAHNQFIKDNHKDIDKNVAFVYTS